MIRFEVEPGRFLAADAYGDASSPPVLLLHGGGQNRHAWGNTAHLLAQQGFYAIALDHRGHGDSDWHPDGAYLFEDFCDDLIAVLEQLESTPILVGASMGGITAMLAETLQPDRSVCQALVLVDVTPRLEAAGIHRIMTFMRAHPDGFSSLDDAADHVAAYMPHRKRPQDTSGLERNLRRGDDGRYRWHWDPRLLDALDLPAEEIQAEIEARLERARTVSVPTLLVRGRMSDVVSDESVQLFLDAVPHAEFVDVAGAAHTVAGDRNDAFTAAVIEFVGRVRGGSVRDQ